MKIFKIELRVWWAAKGQRSYEGDRVYLHTVAPGLPTATRKAMRYQAQQQQVDGDVRGGRWRVSHIVPTLAEFVLEVDVE